MPKVAKKKSVVGSKKSSKASKAKVTSHRDEVIYPEVKVNLCTGE